MKKAIVLFVLVLLPLAAMNTLANDPPQKPSITGPTNGEAGKTYTYTVVTVDPDGDKVKYCIDWGDGEQFCTVYEKSGEEIKIQHTWKEKGTYTITVTATDIHGAESPPATLKVTMPLSKPLNIFDTLLPLKIIEKGIIAMIVELVYHNLASVGR